MAHRARFMCWIIVFAAAACSNKSVDTKKSFTRVQLAKDLLAKGEKQASEVEAQKSLKHDPKNVEAINVLGLVDFLRALDNYRLLEVDDCLTGVDSEALRVEQDDNLLAASKHFERALQINPEYGEAWSNLGVVAIRLGDYNRAIEDLDKALGFPQGLTNVGLTRANLGWAYFLSHNLPRAAKELRQAKQFNPGMCIANYRLGRVYFERHEWQKAAEQLRAVAENKDCPIQEAHLYLMQAYAALGMEDEERAAAQTCIELAPRSCNAAVCRAPHSAVSSVSP